MYRQFKKVLILCLLGLATQSSLQANNVPSASWIAKIGDFFWNRQNSALTTPGKIALGTAALGFGLWKLYKMFDPFNHDDLQVAYTRGDLITAHRLLRSISQHNAYDSQINIAFILSYEHFDTEGIKIMLRHHGKKLNPYHVASMCIRAKTINYMDLHAFCLNYLKENFSELSQNCHIARADSTWQICMAKTILHSLCNTLAPDTRFLNAGLPSITALNYFMQLDAQIEKYVLDHINTESPYMSSLYNLTVHACDHPYERNPYFEHIQWVFDRSDVFYLKENIYPLLEFSEYNPRVTSHVRDKIQNLARTKFHDLTNLPEEIYGVVSSFGYDDSQELLFTVYKNNNHKKLLDLLKNDYDPNVRGFSGATALMYASKWGYSECVETLLKSENIDIFTHEHNGMTALMFAAEAGYADIVKLLLEKDNVQHELVNTQSAGYQNLRYRKKVVPAQQDNAQQVSDSDRLEEWSDIGLSTALMYAARNCPDRIKYPVLAEEYEKIVELLLKHGADRNLLDKHNKTALHYAEENHHAQGKNLDGIIKLLKR